MNRRSRRTESFGFAADGRAVTVDGLSTTCMAVTFSGTIYATESQAGQAWLVRPDGTKTLLDEGLKHPTGIALSPDGLWLAVMEGRTHRGYSYRVKPDGTAEWKQPFYWAHVPDWADDSGAGGMCMDRARARLCGDAYGRASFRPKWPLPRDPSLAGGRGNERLLRRRQV